jgi:hypothetical protein
MAQSVVGRSSAFGELRMWDEPIRWHRGDEIPPRARGPNRPGSHGQIFFSAPKKSASGKWVFPVRDEKSNLPAEAVERQAIWYWRTA